MKVKNKSYLDLGNLVKTKRAFFSKILVFMVGVISSGISLEQI